MYVYVCVSRTINTYIYIYGCIHIYVCIHIYIYICIELPLSMPLLHSSLDLAAPLQSAAGCCHFSLLLAAVSGLLLSAALCAHHAICLFCRLTHNQRRRPLLRCEGVLSSAARASSPPPRGGPLLRRQKPPISHANEQQFPASLLQDSRYQRPTQQWAPTGQQDASPK